MRNLAINYSLYLYKHSCNQSLLNLYVQSNSNFKKWYTFNLFYNYFSSISLMTARPLENCLKNPALLLSSRYSTVVACKTVFSVVYGLEPGNSLLHQEAFILNRTGNKYNCDTSVK